VRVSGCHKKKQEVNFDLLCFWVPGAGLEPAQPLWSQDFKSCVSTIPPSGRFLVRQIYNKYSLIKTVDCFADLKGVLKKSFLTFSTPPT
jgi:hypothetical protein